MTETPLAGTAVSPHPAGCYNSIMNARNLTPRQAAFVAEYLVESSANREGSRLLSKVDVQEAIAAAMKARAERVRVTADWVVERLMREAELTGEGSSHSARLRPDAAGPASRDVRGPAGARGRGNPPHHEGRRGQRRQA